MSRRHQPPTAFRSTSRSSGSSSARTAELATQQPGYILRVALRRRRHRRVRAAPRRREGRHFAPSRSRRPRRACAEALALWRGPALADLASEPFAHAEIARLEGLRLEALDGTVRGHALASGAKRKRSVSCRHSSVSTHSTSGFRGLLMVALYRSGRHADALEAYRTFRQLLDEELGLEPTPELRQLEQAILRQDESLSPVTPLALAAVDRAARRRGAAARRGRRHVRSKTSAGRSPCSSPTSSARPRSASGWSPTRRRCSSASA